MRINSLAANAAPTSTKSVYSPVKRSCVCVRVYVLPVSVQLGLISAVKTLTPFEVLIISSSTEAH